MADCLFFFFQAEDGIRDYKVTGVQTCALPISAQDVARLVGRDRLFELDVDRLAMADEHRHPQDRKSTRLNSSHLVISYAVFCLKKKKRSPSSPTSSYTCTRTRTSRTPSQPMRS